MVSNFQGIPLPLRALSVNRAWQVALPGPVENKENRPARGERRVQAVSQFPSRLRGLKNIAPKQTAPASRR